MEVPGVDSALTRQHLNRRPRNTLRLPEEAVLSAATVVSMVDLVCHLASVGWDRWADWVDTIRECLEVVLHHNPQDHLLDIHSRVECIKDQAKVKVKARCMSDLRIPVPVWDPADRLHHLIVSTDLHLGSLVTLADHLPCTVQALKVVLHLLIANTDRHSHPDQHLSNRMEAPYRHTTRNHPPRQT